MIAPRVMARIGPKLAGRGDVRITPWVVTGPTVLAAITAAEARLTGLRDSPAIAEQPDRGRVDDWLHRSYLDFWARRHSHEENEAYGKAAH